MVDVHGERMGQGLLLAFWDKDEIVLELSVSLEFRILGCNKVNDEIVLGSKDGIRIDVLAISVKDLVYRRERERWRYSQHLY